MFVERIPHPRAVPPAARIFGQAAAAEFEKLAQVALFDQTVRVTLDGWTRGAVMTLPVAPLLDLLTVTVTADGEAFEDFAVIAGLRPALLQALTAIFELYGNRQVLDAHVWHLAEQAMEAVLSVTLSERPRSVTIVEEGAQFVFADVQAGKDLQAAFESQRAANERFREAIKLHDPATVEKAEAHIAEVAQRVRAAADRTIGNKNGVRVTRTLMQAEIIPVALALKEG